MAVDRSTELLLNELYAGVSDAERLAEFTRLAAKAAGSHTAAWTERDTGPLKSEMLAVTSPFDASELKSRYDGDYGAADDNIWFRRAVSTLATGTVLDGERLATTQELKATRYYNDFLRSIDTAHSLAICARHTNNRAVMLSFCRNESAGSYEAEHRHLIATLAPHVVHAERLKTERARIASQSNGKLISAWLDHRLHLLEPNAGIEALARMGVLNARLGAPVSPRHAASRAAWQARLLAIAANPCASPVPVPLYDPQGQLIAVLTLLQWGLYRLEASSRFLCQITLLRSSATPEAGDVLSRMFGLTAAEARFVLALHATSEVAEAAAALGITKETARSRLKAIFLKTGARKQSSLLALVDAVSEQWS